MSEDLKKTTLLPRRAGRMAYNTVVMKRPPEMTVELAVPETEKLAGQDREVRLSANLPPSNVRATLDLRGAQRACPPMTPNLDPARPAATPSLLAARPQATHVAPVQDSNKSSLAVLRTRMVSAQAMPTFQRTVNSPSKPSRLPPPPPPPAPGEVLHTARLHNSNARRQRVRKSLVIGGAAVVLGICLALPASGTTKNAESVAPSKDAVSRALPADTRQPQASSNTATSPPADADQTRAVASLRTLPSTASSTAPTPRATTIAEAPTTSGLAKPKADPDVARVNETHVTEEQAAAMLLAGRREQALAMYRELANSSRSTTGIQAMREVLEQKVGTR